MKTIDAVIILILLLIVTNGLKQSLLHLKGEGSCCGGSKLKIKRKRYLGKPIKTITLYVEDMHCTNCKNRIEASLQKIDGITCNVKLSKKEVCVRMYKIVDESLIYSTISKLGYSIIQ